MGKRGPQPRPLMDKLIPKIECIPECGCWIWVGKLSSRGYGMVHLNKRDRMSAHRAMYQELVGPIPEGKWVLHTCHVRSCCNPSHLYLGHAAENNRDTVNAGNHSNGSDRRTSYVKGVAYSGAKKCFVSYIRHEGKQLHLYRGQDLFEAVCRRKSAELKSPPY